MRKYNEYHVMDNNKIFQYKTMCYAIPPHTYSTNKLEIGEIYDVYLADYPFSTEYEIFKDRVFYTSFILEEGKGYDRTSNGLDNFHKYFYTKEQVRNAIIDKIVGNE